jgi:phosphoribosylaminoimidazole carboxylase (NCAIR synthetase)
VITIEIEHVDAVVLASLEKSGATIHPSPATISVIQDKFRQKQHLEAAGVPLADFMAVSTLESLQDVGAKFGYPFMLKSRTGVNFVSLLFVKGGVQSDGSGFSLFLHRPMMGKGISW